MKKRFSGIIAAIIALICALSLVACGGGNTGNVITDDQGNLIIKENWWSTTGELNKDDDGKVVFNNVEVRMATVVAGEDEGYLSQIIGEFNQKYRGKINIVSESIAEEGYEDTVSKRISNNANPPDLIMSHQKGHRAFADNRLIQPFDEVMEQSGITFDMKDYSDGLAKYTSLGFKDKLFSIPCDAQSMVVLYNKKIIGNRKFPSTHAELLSVCDEIAAEKNIKPISWSTSSAGFKQYLFPTAIIQNGGELYNTESLRAEWDSEKNLPAFKNAIKSIRDLTSRSPKALADVGLSDSASLNNFMNDKAAFYVTTPWETKDFITNYARNKGITVAEARTDYIGAGSVAGWFAVDGANVNANKIFGDSHFFTISKSCTDINKKAAICEFVKWFTQTGSAGSSWAEAGHVTASKVIAADSAYTGNSFVTDYINKFYPDINNFECPGNSPYFYEIRTYTGSLIGEALGNATEANDETIIKTTMRNLNYEIDM